MQVVGGLKLELCVEILEKTFFCELDYLGPLIHNFCFLFGRDRLVLYLDSASQGKELDQIANEAIESFSELDDFWDLEVFEDSTLEVIWILLIFKVQKFEDFPQF